MDVLVTGASGFLGKALMARLAADGRNVAGTARSSRPGVEACDLADPAALWSLLDRLRPAAIVHAGASIDFSPGSLARMYPVNVLATGIVAAWAAKAGAHLVFCSSIAVHGGRAPHIHANTAIAPDGDYGRSKALAEELILASGAHAAILRLPGLYGLGGPEHLGLNRAINGAAAGMRPQLNGPGSGRRNYLHAADAAAMIAACLDRRLDGVHAAGGAEPLSIAQWLAAVCARWLPGQEPVSGPGGDCCDQLVDHSSALPSARPVVQTLAEDP